MTKNAFGKFRQDFRDQATFATISSALRGWFSTQCTKYEGCFKIPGLLFAVSEYVPVTIQPKVNHAN